MLKRVRPQEGDRDVSVTIGESDFPVPFPTGLEYGAPARGVWNIVHIGMLIPESHQIFVCAGNCLRGVVLTAAEMGASHRFSTITIKEENVLDGDMEELIVEGVTDIVNRLPKQPRAILLYFSCIHHFVGCDLRHCMEELQIRFPHLEITDCYMNPIMRKSGMTPDQMMRQQLYSLVPFTEEKDRGVNILGSCFPTDESSDVVRMLRAGGYPLREITRCESYDDYRELGKSWLNITYLPSAKVGGDTVSQKLGQTHLHLPISYTADVIEANARRLSACLGVSYDSTEDRRRAEEALHHAKAIVGEVTIAIDYTVTPAPLSLARLLLEHGFRVETVYLDTISEPEEFRYLKQHFPQLRLAPTVHTSMRVLPRETEETVLAIGQKAAYFTGTKHFVNMVEGGGAYGFDGIVAICRRIQEAFLTEREPSQEIQQKGWGCSCCL